MTDTVQDLRVSKVLRVPAAEPAEAAAYFWSRFTFQCDVSDVHHDIEEGTDGFVLVDTRGQESWDQGHVPGALHLPTDDIAARAAELVEPGTLVVTYCWGPGCNGATRAAHAFAALGYQVKEMMGGYEYWVREGFAVEDIAGRRSEPVDILTAPRTVHCDC
jgi:rhodanese-related sulfurtransferase